MTKILVVDDDFIVRDLFERVLGKDGYEVLTADTGENCLEMIAREGAENIDMVFLDLKMPGIGGETTLKTLKDCYKKLPVVIISAYGDFYTRVKMMKQKAIKYIAKPFDIEDIKVILRNKGE